MGRGRSLVEWCDPRSMIGVNCAVAMQSALRHRTNSADKMLGRISTPVAAYDLRRSLTNNPCRRGIRCWLNNYALLDRRA